MQLAFSILSLLFRTVTVLFTPSPKGYVRWTGQRFVWDHAPAPDTPEPEDSLLTSLGTLASQPGERLTAPPMEEPGRHVAPPPATYEEAIERWCVLHGLDCTIPAHHARAEASVAGQYCQLGADKEGHWRMLDGRGVPVVYITGGAPHYSPPPDDDRISALARSTGALVGMAMAAASPPSTEARLPNLTPVRQPSPPEQVAQLLRDYSGPWWIAGGWALELWLGEAHREHQDVEIALPRTGLDSLRDYLAGFTFVQCVAAGEGRERWPLAAGQAPVSGVHELHARRGPHATRRPLNLLELEVLLNDVDGQTWRYRRNPAVTLPVSRLGLGSAEGIPYLAPEAVLLYKAGQWRPAGLSAGTPERPVIPKDAQDFAAALPHLDTVQKSWLRDALALAHPGHPWLEQLG